MQKLKDERHPMAIIHTPLCVHQTPGPGTRILMYPGDIIRFTLRVDSDGSPDGPGPVQGSAWMRTNIGRANITRREIIREVEDGHPPLGTDWFDIPLRRVSARGFEARLALTEVGHFEAKGYFLPEGAGEPLWPAGPNVTLNVSPSHTCCANIIYNAFVRQFGPNKNGGFQDRARVKKVHDLDQAGYNVIPPSGTFRDLIRELDFIGGTLGCRILQLLPIHPTPTTYARMGRFGSPYAALNFTEVDPALAEFDPRATPLDQFMELADAVHRRHMQLWMDIAINHTGWAASLHAAHPEWLARTKEGDIEVPGAWGVEWADLTRLDYTHTDLWRYMAGIFLTWCRRGVDGFRCDAGYMIPLPAWRYMIAKVRDQFPDTVFLLEGLGGKRSVTRDLLDRGNFDGAYSEVFQTDDRGGMEAYLPEVIKWSGQVGQMVHFAETHDNNRLASVSIPYARMRTALCALLSQQGAFGFANGVEWYATEKINVHEANDLNRGSPVNQVDGIQRLNRLLTGHPAFQDQVEVTMLQQGEGNHLAAWRHHRPTGKWVVVLINLDMAHPAQGRWHAARTPFTSDPAVDLLSGQSVTVHRDGDSAWVALSAGEVLCLSPDRADLTCVEEGEASKIEVPARIVRQRLQAKALIVLGVYHQRGEVNDFDADAAGDALYADPVGFCRDLNPRGHESRVARWEWPRDVRRDVMVPPGYFLLIHAQAPFEGRIEENGRVLAREAALPQKDGSFFALFSPLSPRTYHVSCTLTITVHASEGCRHAEAPLLFLSRWHTVKPGRGGDQRRIAKGSFYMLGTNCRGGMMRACVSWGDLHSRYDALLAGNLNPEVPEDRWIMFTRCRAWLVYQGYSQALNTDCLHAFSLNSRSEGCWHFQVPAGQGQHVWLIIGVEMIPYENAVRLLFYRPAAGGPKGSLAEQARVRLILRPDVEDRSFHDTTKAYTGPEHRYAEAVMPGTDHLIFSPDPVRQLFVGLSSGTFVWEPEWTYMVGRDRDAERGMDPDSDLFSPGYFRAELGGGEAIELVARINGHKASDRAQEPDLSHMVRGADVKKGSDISTMVETLEKALDDFVVRRGPLKSIIAGYPWFLDWGRDALIAVRGLIASGRVDDAEAVLKQFGRFEQDGTLPNMIRGEDAANRDTSDAPLWYVVCCNELVEKTGNHGFLDATCGGRTIRDILHSIGRAYVKGTPNGIRMDPGTGLIFSPAHFTWMDTQHPAGTPRAGYPVEIQALWFRALYCLSCIDGRRRDRWLGLAKKVQDALHTFFWLDGPGHLSDCLHVEAGGPPYRSAADDALRPNQLFAITLGAVTDPGQCRKILSACETLLVPGAIRSLADRPVQRPLEIRHHGRPLNDPRYPYWGTYAGDEDTRRKPAYHNGTAWTWPFPTFCEAWAMVYGTPGRQTALAYLSSTVGLIEEGCIGHVPEIVDGNVPHAQRGCDAQAWGASEMLRVWLQLTQKR